MSHAPLPGAGMLPPRLLLWHLLCSPTHSSTLLMNPSALALQQINMASRCELPGLEMWSVVKCLPYMKEAQALIPRTTIKTIQHNKTLRAEGRRDASEGKGQCCQACSQRKERTSLSPARGQPWLVRAPIHTHKYNGNNHII